MKEGGEQEDARADHDDGNNKLHRRAYLTEP
jgi:hypothetical protein